ncbi:MAG TPA: YciK family oxidoreductase [Candidatus Competibacteraceae bacterium]|nr:YciK family oxidoreductase [Candidatus Competibacteraceae bacterium]
MSQLYQPVADLLRERVILVTGAGDGIGRAAARTFAAFGATVALLGRTTRKLEMVYDEIERAGHPQPAIIPLNLEGATPKDYADLVEALDGEFGRLDGLLHNAALLGTLTPIGLYDPELWHQVLQVNLNGPFMLTQALLGLLARSEDASVVFTHDPVCDGRAYWGAYGVAKGGQRSLMRILASELETNTAIRVNAIDPGEVHSGIRIRAYPAGDREAWAEPDSIMAAYLYLMGPDSKGVTGQILKAADWQLAAAG